MSRRTRAGLLALGLAAVLVLVAALRPVGYVTFKPGPTVDVLSSYQGEKIIQIRGRKVYEDGGSLRLLTVYTSGPEQKLDLVTVFAGWASSEVAVLPRKNVYGEQDTRDSVRQESALQMSSSQDNAKAAGLRAAGIAFTSEPVISAVLEGGASAGILKAGDVVLAVDGVPVKSSEAVVSKVTALKPGTKVAFTVRRTEAVDPDAEGSPEPKTSTQKLVVTTRADTEDPKTSRVNVSIGERPIFPFEVDISLGDSIGGPSAGMIFALSIYDLLTPGSLTGGKSIAGTGEISADGVVGAIGGIAQKMVGAQRDGAELFLVPRENWSEAISSSYDKDEMKLVCVHTIDEALTAINTWREDPAATLAGCSK